MSKRRDFTGRKTFAPKGPYIARNEHGKAWTVYKGPKKPENKVYQFSLWNESANSLMADVSAHLMNCALWDERARMRTRSANRHGKGR